MILQFFTPPHRRYRGMRKSFPSNPFLSSFCFTHIEYYRVPKCVTECFELMSTLSEPLPLATYKALNVRISHVRQVKFLRATFQSYHQENNHFLSNRFYGQTHLLATIINFQSIALSPIAVGQNFF